MGHVMDFQQTMCKQNRSLIVEQMQSIELQLHNVTEIKSAAYRFDYTHLKVTELVWQRYGDSGK